MAKGRMKVLEAMPAGDGKRALLRVEFDEPDLVAAISVGATFSVEVGDINQGTEDDTKRERERRDTSPPEQDRNREPPRSMTTPANPPPEPDADANKSSAPKGDQQPGSQTSFIGDRSTPANNPNARVQADDKIREASVQQKEEKKK